MVGSVGSEMKAGKMMTQIYLEAWDQFSAVPDEDVNEILSGAIDTHVHGFPDIRYRTSLIDTCKKAVEFGLKAIVYKCHYLPTPGVAWMTEQLVNEWAKQNGLKPLKVFGGIALNASVGGYNPFAVEVAVRYPGCKVVWTPTMDARHAVDMLARNKPGIYALDKSGGLLPEVLEVLEIIAGQKGKIAIAMGHISPQEMIQIAKEAKSKRIEVLIDHAFQREPTLFAPDELRTLTKLGAYIGMAAMTSKGDLATEAAEAIRQLGPEHVILQSDYGQAYSSLAPEGLKFFLREIMSHGFTKSQMKLMVQENPKKLLHIE